MSRIFSNFLKINFILVCLVVGYIGTAQAAVNLNVNLNVGPPPVVMSEPPEVVMMPETGVYFVPAVSFDLFFFNGNWWSPRGWRWYMSRAYNGPWGIIRRNQVPANLVRVPKNYREVYKQVRHVNYKQWRSQNYGSPQSNRPQFNGQRRGGNDIRGRRDQN